MKRKSILALILLLIAMLASQALAEDCPMHQIQMEEITDEVTTIMIPGRSARPVVSVKVLGTCAQCGEAVAMNVVVYSLEDLIADGCWVAAAEELTAEQQACERHYYYKTDYSVSHVVLLDGEYIQQEGMCVLCRHAVSILAKP